MSGTYLRASPLAVFPLSVDKGGTGLASYTIGDLLYASAATTLSKLAAGTSGHVLTSNGPGVAPSWQAAGSAGISGSTGSVDNALLRADGAGGSTLQSSDLTIGDLSSRNLAVTVTANATADANPGNAITIKGGNKTATTGSSGKGGALYLYGGDTSGTTSGADGGDVVIIPGEATTFNSGRTRLRNYLGAPREFVFGTQSSQFMQCYAPVTSAVPQYSVTNGAADPGATGGIYYGLRVDTNQILFYTDNSSTSRMDIDSAATYVHGDLRLPTVGKGIRIKEGSNAKMGQSTLVGGTVTVSTTAVTANSRIFITRAVAGGTIGNLSIGTVVAGTSFVIDSSSGTETSTINWVIFEPA